MAELFGAIDRRETFHVEHSLARPDGDVRWVSTHGTVRTLPSGAVTVHGVSQDLTERQRLVEALQTTDRLKDRFLGVVSHELRTPLTSIVGFSQMLLDHADDETRPWIEILARNAEDMHGMVERILDYSRLHAGAMDLNFEALPVDALVDELRSLVAVPLMDHDLVVDLEPGLVVLADRNAMFRILVNLLTNSAKFSPSGSPIRIEGRSVTDCDEIRLCVVDEGHGIPGDQRESVFERFHQVESDDIGTRHGVGVGLTIVKEYVEAMSGTVWVDHAGPASGTTITVQLPKPSASR
jgi:signal transduction histidine kinase